MADSLTLPGLNCGLCGWRTCDEFQKQVAVSPDLVDRCIHLSSDRVKPVENTTIPVGSVATGCATGCGSACPSSGEAVRTGRLPVVRKSPGSVPFRDSLDREFDFYLLHFPEDPGPREIIIPHNPMITRELDIKVGDILIGRPLGMSCGCPITHCGIVMQVDHRTGVLTWCVTGPLGPRQHGFKDLGYYIAEGYEGLVERSRCELKIGMRYYFQPEMCMLQWRHSGLLNYLNRNGNQYQVRLEGLWIG